MDKKVSPLAHVDPYSVVRGMIRVGMTKTNIAEALGLSDKELATLIRVDPKLQDIFEKETELPNFLVEQALFRRALGYEAKEVKKVLGKPVEVHTKRINPDVAACIFWLKNRDPERWKETVDVRLTLRDRMDQADLAVKTGVIEAKFKRQKEIEIGDENRE